MTWSEQTERVREALKRNPFADDAYAALDALTAQMEELEQRANANFTHAASGDVAEILLLRRMEELEGELDEAETQRREATTSAEREIKRATAQIEKLEQERQELEIGAGYMEEKLRAAEQRVKELLDEADELLLWQPGKKGYAAAHGRFFAVVHKHRAALAQSDPPEDSK